MDVIISSKMTRSKTKVWLIGFTEDKFKTSKLPSASEVLKVLFYYHNDEKLSLKDSISRTTELLLEVWQRARIPTKAPNHVAEHIKKLHTEWQSLKKLINRKSKKNLANQNRFQNRLNNMFDVAHRDAMSLIKIDEDRTFLEAQREPGRKGMMVGVDQNLRRREQRALKRKVAELDRAEAEKTFEKSRFATVSSITAVSPENSDTGTGSDAETAQPEAQPGPSRISTNKTPRLRGAVKLVTPEVAAALDRTKTTDRMAAYIFAAMASSSSSTQLKSNASELIISASAIRRERIKFRKSFAEEAKSSFNEKVPLILHWDGKIMDDFTSSGVIQGKVDRLPILVSGAKVIKLLAIPKLNAGTADVMAREIIQTVDDWELRDRISGLCFDTTATNTGSKSGICLRLEQQIGRKLLNLGCRHHIAELILQAVYGLYDVSKSGDIELFRQFRDFWPQINRSQFSTATEDDMTASIIAPWKDGIIEFALAQLKDFQPRDDYCELLELTIIFLGGSPPRGKKFRYPGAIHRSRWMARAIYVFKIWLFRDQFPILHSSRNTRGLGDKTKILNHLTRVSLFVAEVYVKYWFQCPAAVSSPRNDLNLLRTLSTYHDKQVAGAARKAFNRHLWYLSELLIGFSFYDDEVTADEKRLMVTALKEKEGSDEVTNRAEAPSKPEESGLHDFVTKSTHQFFHILHISTDFLNYDVNEWNNLETYSQDKVIVKSTRVVNDLAERSVALIQDFNSSLTRNEEQKQFLLQVVESHRNMFPAPRKSDAINKKFKSHVNK